MRSLQRSREPVHRSASSRRTASACCCRGATSLIRRVYQVDPLCSARAAARATALPTRWRSTTWPWGEDEPDRRHANLDQVHLGPAGIGAYPAGVSAVGCHQMLGDVWEWTSSDFASYPGFVAFPYAEYSEVFHGADYKVLRGGSWATARAACRTTFRNWDLPVRRQIFAGFRCARDEAPSR